MDLIYANSERKDLGIVRAYNFDLAFGSDENNFELKIDTDNHCCEAGYYVYIEGTEYGGIIDAVTSDTAAEEVTYTGRTWHGILNSKVLCPDSGQDYLTLNGNANTVLSTLISRMGLTSIFAASSDVSALTISSYKMERYITGYDGIRKMLNSVNGKLVMSYNGTKVILSAVPIVDYTDAGVIDSDIMSFSVKKTSRKVNHLICLGQGELKDRTVVHIYADTSGSISQSQTLTGLDEYTAVYDNPNAESIEKLREAGSEQLTELQKQDDLSVSLSEGEDVFDVGDIVGAVDNVTGIAISVPISKKIISIQNDYLSAAYETEIGKVRTSNSGQINGSGGTAATISIGTVTTGAAGSDAQVTNSGTPTAAVLNFVIPRGDAGAADGAVRYDITQTLSDTEKAKARANIGAGTSSAGADGATFIPSVSADGTLSWTNNKGLTNPEPVNIKGEDGAFRINVTYSNGVYSADKTFAEIKAAYEAGQQPYVVLTGGTLDSVYTLAYFSVPDGTGQDFVDFKRCLVGEGILETEMLRVYSYTTDSGSNVVKRIDEFKMPTSLKNPNALTFTGGATGSYDGSEPKTVHIPVIPYEVINKNTAARHSHDNKTVLDGITAEKVTEWDSKNSITDSGGYFTSDTVEGALQEIGAELTGINTLLGSGEITS